MYQWNAKVHKSGTKVAIFNGKNLVKVVEASKETFEPAEAQKFAEELVSELTNRTSAQMTTPSAAPSTTTESELQNATMNAVTQQATGKGAGEEKTVETLPEEMLDEQGDEKVASENKNLKQVISNLKKKLAQERNERVIERKARRGLAIAKQLVVEGKLEDSYDAIKMKVAEIVKLEDSEIDRLERKTAGDQEFDSVEDAMKEIRRQSRISRINRQAAAEAQEDGDEEQADVLDKKADEAEAKVAHLQQIVDEMNKTAETSVPEEKVATEEKPVEEKTATEETPTEEKTAAEETPVVPPVEEKKEEEKADAPAAEVPPVEEKKEEKADATEATPVEEKKEEEQCAKASDESTEKLAALARKYRSIAANHRKLAEKAETEGDVEAADKQDAMADDAEEKAEDIEKKLAETKTAEEKKEETPAEEKTEEAVEEDNKEATIEVENKEANVDEEEKKEAAKKNPGSTVTSSEHSTLKREGAPVEDSFGIDKNASLVEENDYSNDPEVEILSKMWRGAPKDEE
jgi:hypothetical protein